MSRKRIPVLIFASLLALALSSCAQKWLTDFDEASSLAKKGGRRIVLFFSGEDWDQKSSAFKESVLLSKDFAKDFPSKEYVLCQVDYSQSEYGKTFASDDGSATEAQKSEAEEIRALYAKKEELAYDYGLSVYPSLYFLTSEGYVLAEVPWSDELKTSADVKAALEAKKDLAEKVSLAAQKAQQAAGKERLSALDSLYESVELKYRGSMDKVAEEIVALDSDGSAGLRSKYELLLAYSRAVRCMRSSDADGAVKAFTDAAEGGHLDAEQTQEAYYSAFYVLTVSGSDDFDRMESLVRKSFEAAPQSSHVQDLNATLEALERTREYAEHLGDEEREEGE